MPLHGKFDLIFFGGTGDLALRKLLPAMYYRLRDTQDSSGWRILCGAREPLDQAAFQRRVHESCREFIPAEDFDEETWKRFSDRLEYLQVDASELAGFVDLAQRLNGSEDRIRVFYLATASRLFAPISAMLAEVGAVTPLSRVVLEKPLGHDQPSSEAINAAVGKVFEESQIYRIDHYLGKETVQNLMALRFGNSIFEPLWNRGNIRQVQITLAETVGVGGRGDYYDKSGALRDMVQSHLLQLLCILAMETPTSTDPDAVRDEKLKVLRVLRPFDDEAVRKRIVRGQYRSGAIDGKAVPGYLEEEDVPSESTNETFVAIKAQLDNWRWSGVPFFLRTGKRMQERLAEIVVYFRDVPHPILPQPRGETANRLIIQLQPDESVQMFVMAKVPGDEMKLRPVALDLDFGEAFKIRQWGAYERLISDVIAGRLTLFMRRDELDAAWRWVDPIIAAWEEGSGESLKRYAAGTWGPTAASALLAKDDLAWHEEMA